MQEKIKNIVKAMRDSNIMRITYDFNAFREEDAQIEIWFSSSTNERIRKFYDPEELEE